MKEQRFKAASGMLFIVFALTIGSSSAEPPEPPFTVRDLLNGMHFKSERRELMALGTSAYPEYLRILDDPMRTPVERARILGVASSIESDRSGFHRHAVEALDDDNSGVRYAGIALLQKIGSTRDAARIIARLSDTDKSNVYFAAKTLAIIGGPKEVVAMDAWLSGPVYANDKQLRAQVMKSRSELAERLAKMPKP